MFGSSQTAVAGNTALVTDIDYTPHQQKDFINKLGIEVKDVQRAAIYIAVKKPDYL